MSEEAIIGGADETGLTILCASAVRQALTDCARRFNAGGGGRVHFRFDTSGGIQKRLEAGEVPDIAASSLDAIQYLEAHGLLNSAPAVVGTSRIALGVRKGAPVPDISSVLKFKAVMLGAGSIARGDPQGGGTAGNYLHGVLKKLGLLDATASKTILRVGGYNVMKEVAEGRADFGLTQSTEIAAVEGVEIGTWLPDEIQLVTAYALALTKAGRANDRALAFLNYVQGPEGALAFARAGFAAAG
jgi:molybdate transport system substrate-binding protein